MLSQLGLNLPTKAQSSCQATINSVVNELKSKGVRRVMVDVIEGGERREGNPTNRINGLMLVLSPDNANYTYYDSRSASLITNIMMSPVLMKSYSDRIVSNCNDIAVVYFGADKSDWVIDFAIQSNGKTRKRDCIDNDPRITPNWNQRYCL